MSLNKIFLSYTKKELKRLENYLTNMASVILRFTNGILATTPHPITNVTPEQSNTDLKRIKELQEEVEI